MNLDVMPSTAFRIETAAKVLAALYSAGNTENPVMTATEAWHASEQLWHTAPKFVHDEMAQADKRWIAEHRPLKLVKSSPAKKKAVARKRPSK